MTNIHPTLTTSTVRTCPPMPPVQPAPLVLIPGSPTPVTPHVFYQAPPVTPTSAPPKALARAIPQEEGCTCLLIFRPTCSHIQMATLQHIGLSIWSTTWPHRVASTKIQRLPSLTSSLVR